MGFISNLLLGDNSEKATYRDAAQAKAYRDITEKTLDRAYEGSKDYLDKNYSGGFDKYKSDLMYGLQDQATDTLKRYNASKNDVFGNGLIGNLLNPIAQTVSGVGDLALMGATGGKYNAWDGSNNYLGTHRDIMSDLGALGETALTVAPIAKGLSVAKAGKAVKAGTATTKQAAKWAASQAPKSLGRKIAGGALLGAGYGATGSLRDMGSENFDPQQLMMSAGVGAGVAGGLAGLGGLWNKYTTGNATVAGDMLPYQEALDKLKNNATGARYSNVATNLPTTQGPDLARVTLNNLDDDTLKTLYRSASRNTHPDKVGEAVGDSLFKSVNESNNLLQDFLKNGAPTTTATTKAANLGEALKNLKTNVRNTKTGGKVAKMLKTKKGKVVAGAGAGLLLSQLLGNRNSNNEQLSDEELAELYNYVYGGQ